MLHSNWKSQNLFLFTQLLKCLGSQQKHQWIYKGNHIFSWFNNTNSWKDRYVWPPLYIFVHIWNRISRMLYIGHELDFTLSQTRSNTNTIQIQCKIFWPTQTTIYCKSFNVQLKKYLFCINQANKRAIKLNSLAISMNFTFTMVVKGLYP